MTQYGSSSDRPRGRRARPESDEREFPDLQPIRPAGARESDARNARTSGGRHAGGQQPEYGGHNQYGGQEQYGATRPRGRHTGGQPSLGQPPGQPAGRSPGQEYGGGQRPAHPAGWEDADPGADDPMAAFSERWHRRGQDTPADRTKRRRLFYAGGGVVVVALGVLVYFLTAGGNSGANTGLGDVVTTFLPGELQTVPNACTSVPASTLSQDLPGQHRMASPPLNSGAQSLCTWTLDSAPTYRVLQVNITAYPPSSLASGTGSATFAAIDAWSGAKSGKANPPKASGQPKAQISDMPGVGDSAFSAFQEFNENGAIMDMATVYVRYHNVVVQVVLNGLDQANSDSPQKYGPVQESQLRSQAQDVATQVAQKVTSS